MTRNKKGTEKEMRMDGEQGKSPKKPETYISTLRTFYRGIKPESKESKKSAKIQEGTGKWMRMDGEQGKSPKKTGSVHKYVEDFL